MSGKKKSTFLTESTFIDEQKIAERENTKTDENSVKESSVSNEDEDEYSDNENPDDEDYDDEFNPDAYPNPYLQQFNQTANANIIKEEKEDEENHYEENLRPLSALAPKVMLQDEAQVEVSSTPAFQCLEDVNIK